jgi:RNase H-fold protein (predicted Holliday junction resolvase)
VVTHDETLSSQEALELLRHKTRKKRRNDHQYAAALMLQDYLDQQLAK